MTMLKRGATHCQDIMDKIWHPVGSSWTNKKCVKCTCKADGMRCCDGLPKIFNVPEDCTVEYNYKTCTFKVSEKKNPSIPCSHSAVGK
ncbi:beta-microseminoprotein-like [Colossoma macropomum]|uniref:beta-microseminoprotein-like n=1 Tax=Colossoma macropomum TaxID=42526 RepID=UPI001864DDB2|nr:beta-microseminoprotein-like [Colossoma macropomum]